MKSVLIISLCVILGINARAQITIDSLREFLSQSGKVTSNDVKRFYGLTGYKTVWLQKENSGNRTIFLDNLKQSSGRALKEADYQIDLMESIRNGSLMLKSAYDSMVAEVRITDAAIHFYYDLLYGNAEPALEFNGLKDLTNRNNVPDLLSDNIKKNTLQFLGSYFSNSLPEIRVMENKIKSFMAIMADASFKETVVESNKVKGDNRLLILKLYQLGIIDSPRLSLPDSTVKKMVMEAQLQFDLVNDGVLKPATMSQLNIPLSERLQQLILSVNYYRWLSHIASNGAVIVVNIPAAYLKVYSGNTVILEMRMVVGKLSTPTPTLVSTVKEVVLYPYWHVPFKIASGELLPRIKKNPEFIDAGNYQILNASGKIIDPYSVNWSVLSSSNFPFTIRQSSGCDNALGLLKVNFYNPFDVYLHDTPSKNGFTMKRRFFSHGCMRMADPLGLAHLVLKNNPVAIDTLTQKGCLRNQSPVAVPADDKMPVVVWYNPVAMDSTGRILFYEDVYRKFKWKR